MKKKEKLKLISSEKLAKDTVELVLRNDYISRQAEPGQFVHLALAHHTLRRPISIAETDQTAGTVTLLFKIVGEGTRLLASLPVGTEIDALGPNGNGFPISELKTGDSVLLVGGGVGVPPLYFLASALKKQGISVQSVLGFQEKAAVFYEAAFQELGETQIVTNDGSYGHQGFVTDVIKENDSTVCYYSCGPLPMLAAVQKKLKHKQGYLSFEERMGCGIGACYACVIPTKEETSYKKICQDGPVFAASEVIL